MYPVPPEVTSISYSEPFTTTEAAAPAPPPPVISIAGVAAASYPLPTLVISIPVTPPYLILLSDL